MRPRTIIGILILLGFSALLFLNFGQQVGGYMDFDAAADTGSRAHVVGEWVEDRQYNYDPATNVFSFHMRDEKGVVRRVIYRNTKPANFEDAERLVVDGRSENGEFVAEHILVKCPSKYNDQRAIDATTTSASSS